MKKIFIILSSFILLFSSCDTDFDVNAHWEEIAVVYGLLDASLDTQYVRINKAYLGEGDAISMAQHADSINFNLDDLDVKLHKLGFNDTLMSIPLEDTVFYKEDGLFAVDKNIIYRVIPPSGFLNKNNRYAITINNINTGNQVHSNTEIIGDFEYSNIDDDERFGFVVGSQQIGYDFFDKTIRWEKSDNGEVYQLTFIFNYKENGILKSLVWTQGMVSTLPYETKLEASSLFTLLGQHLSDDSSVILRQFVGIDLIMTVGTRDLNNYMKLNEPITGIVQQRPQFTNINNGIGIFSSRFSYTTINHQITQATREYLSEMYGFQ